MKAVRGIIFLAVMIVFLLAGGMTDVQAGFEGNSNTFYGSGAGYSTTGDDDWSTFIGTYAGFNNTTGSSNTFIGNQAGPNNTTGSNNTFIGQGAGTFNTTGGQNTFLGKTAGYTNTTGGANTFIGQGAGTRNTTGSYNTFFGWQAGYDNTTGFQNTFLGGAAGNSNTTGYYNTFVGQYTGLNNTTGYGNVFLGYRAGDTETGSNKLYIANDSSTPLIYGEFDNNMLQINGKLNVVNSNSGLVELTDNTTDAAEKGARMVVSHYYNAEEPVYLFGSASTSTDNYVALGGGNVIGNAATQIDLFTAPNTTTPAGTPRLTIKSDGKVGIGTQTPSEKLYVNGNIYATGNVSWGSSRELKENIRELTVDEAVTALSSLQPQKYYYKADNRDEHIGFIAEDVPQLVATGDRKSLDPMDIVAVLTSVVKQQQKTISALSAELQKIKQEVMKGNLAKAEYIP